jgi:uncharacterized protein DUF5642
MRPLRIGPVATLALTVLVAACAHSPVHTASTAPTKPASPTAVAVHPANIKRVVRELPPGYEVSTAIPGAASPRVVWSFEADASEITAKPPQCAVLGDPGNGYGQSAQGVSGSGSGGIVDAVVVALPGPAHLPHDLVAACDQWTMTGGHTVATVRLTDGPHIDGADTLGMVADIKSSVESGTEITSRAYTFTAYLGDYYAFTTLTTDPGSALPTLSPQFAADLLVKTVSTLRS